MKVAFIAWFVSPMIDVHVHVVPPNLPGVGSLSRMLREPAETIAAMKSYLG